MPKYKVFAAIEVGAMRVAMQIAEISKSKIISVIDTVKYELPIGRETYTIGKISYENVDKICSCLEKFAQIMKEYRVDDYTCYATTAIREAKNSEYIIEQINIRTGLKVSILSNEEERFLHNKAIALKTGYFDDIIEKSAVLVDVSSGSVQVSYYRDGELKFSQNISMGSLRMIEELSELKREKMSFYDLISKYIDLEIERLKSYFSFENKYEYAVFFGNHIPNIRKLCKIKSDDTLNYDSFNDAYRTLVNMSFEDISYKFDIPYDEVEQILTTLLIFKSFMNKRDLKIVIPEITLADGICVEYVEKNGYTHTKHIFTNDILSSAMYCAQKYNVNEKHIEKSTEFAEKIFKALSKRYNLSKHDFLLLRVAAIFIDTGKYISLSDYRKYSTGIVKAAPLIGLSKNDTDIITGIVLESEVGAGLLTKRRRLLVSKLSSILQLSKSLDVERNQVVENITASLKNNVLLINAEANRDLVFEKRRFEAEKQIFEDVFGITAELKITRRR